MTQSSRHVLNQHVDAAMTAIRMRLLLLQARRGALPVPAKYFRLFFHRLDCSMTPNRPLQTFLLREQGTHSQQQTFLLRTENCNQSNLRRTVGRRQGLNRLHRIATGQTRSPLMSHQGKDRARSRRVRYRRNLHQRSNVN